MTIASTFPNGLRPLQIEGAMDCWLRRSNLLADQPGAGKTAQIEFALELDGQFTDPAARILITAPKTACQLMWSRELHERVAGQHPVVIADLTGPCGSRKRRSTPTMAQRNTYLGQKMIEADDQGLPLIVLTNFEGVRIPPSGKAALTNLWQMRYSAIIVDESHQVLPTREDDDAKLTQFWRGLTRLVTTPKPMRLSISGTPDNGLLANRFGHYRFMHPESYPSFWAWARYFFSVKSNGRGGAEIGFLKREAEWNALQAGQMTRRTKAEMLTGLPPKQWINVPLALTEELRDRYDEFEQETLERIEFLSESDDPADQREAQGIRFTYPLRARQLAITDWYVDLDGKWHPKGSEVSSIRDWVIEWLDERGHHHERYDASLGKVVITSYFVEVLHWLQEELAGAGIGRTEILSGDTPAHEKHRIEQEFQRGNLRILLFSGHIGTSISLDAADDMIFTDFPYDPDKVEQTEDRIHRASSTGVKTFWRLFSEDTIAETILSVTDKRYAETRKSYDGSRGAEFRRQMLRLEKEGTAA